MRKGEVVLLLDRSSSLWFRMPERMTLNICRGFRKNCVIQRVVNAREVFRGKDK